MPAELFMAELTVSDWRRSADWYSLLLGAEVDLTDAANGFALLKVGGRLSLKQGEPNPGNSRLVFRVDDLDAELERLSLAGVKAEGNLKVSDEGYRRAVFRDPDGHAVVLFEWVTGAR